MYYCQEDGGQWNVPVTVLYMFVVQTETLAVVSGTALSGTVTVGDTQYSVVNVQRLARDPVPPSIAEYIAHAVSMGETRRLAIRDAVRFYRLGELPPNYPVPATEIDNALAMSPERATFRTKRIILRNIQD